MFCYGYKLSTTPNIDAFGRKATVFTNFCSGSTFTTPCIVTMITGLFPSAAHIYQMQGRVRGPKTVSQVKRDAGYSTGAFLSNSNAFYLAQSLENACDLLPEPDYQTGALQHLWDITTPLHQNTAIGDRLDEDCGLILTWNSLTRLPFDLFAIARRQVLIMLEKCSTSSLMDFSFGFML